MTDTILRGKILSLLYAARKKPKQRFQPDHFEPLGIEFSEALRILEQLIRYELVDGILHYRNSGGTTFPDAGFGKISPQGIDVIEETVMPLITVTLVQIEGTGHVIQTGPSGVVHMKRDDQRAADLD